MDYTIPLTSAITQISENTIILTHPINIVLMLRFGYHCPQLTP